MYTVLKALCAQAHIKLHCERFRILNKRILRRQLSMLVHKAICCVLASACDYST
jgi:hypothetical protein